MDDNAHLIDTIVKIQLSIDQRTVLMYGERRSLMAQLPSDGHTDLFDHNVLI